MNFIPRDKGTRWTTFEQNRPRLMLLRISLPLLALFALLQYKTAIAQFECQHSKQSDLHGHLKGGGAAATWPMDIIHQRIALDLTQANTIAANCTVTATPREIGVDALQLHLLQLTVDSVTDSNGQMTFSHVGELLNIDLGNTIDPGDTITLTIHYRGTPGLDPSGFGGLYFSGSYTYNLGVAFSSIPHSYGRAWFPCVDNFTERNTYEFEVRTTAGNNAWCNGELVDDVEANGERMRTWRLDKLIPAYLAAIASAPYTSLHDQFTSINGNAITVSLVALPADTANMRASFANLPIAFSCFEDWFGAFYWNKVGYVLTPLGAMEHATSIHYPRSIVNGTLTREDIMAHELAHEWFGNVITCERPEEMYINEGFAEYLSYLFLERVYGRQRYMDLMRTNHRNMVVRAHITDEGWWALADVPQQWTYGEHSYNKAAAVIHSMRAYMGDENFSSGLTSFIQNNAFSAVNTAQLRDHLTQSSGVDMNDFFADWILQPGWASFEVDSFSNSVSGNLFPTTVHVQQKMRGPAAFYNNVPIQVSCIADDGQRWDAPTSATVGGEVSSFIVEPPFAPAQILLNSNGDLSLAITTDSTTIAQTGSITFGIADLRLTVNNFVEPFPIRVEEYWVAADEGTEENFAFVVSPDRWWRVIANIPEGTEIMGRIIYDGRNNSSGLDIGLMQNAAGVTFNEDSLVLLYRPDQRSLWSVYPDFSVNVVGNATDRSGRIEFNGLRQGEYTMGWRKSATGIGENTAIEKGWSLYPNPANDVLFVSWKGTGSKDGSLQLTDMQGRIAMEVPYTGDQTSVDLRSLSTGTYNLLHLPRKGPAQTVDRVVLAR